MKFISIALPLTFVFAALASAESFGVPAGTDLKDWKVPTSDLNRFNSDDFFLGYKGRDVQDDEASSLDRRAIINGVDRTDKKPSAAAKVLTNFIYKVTGWNKGSRSEDEELPNFKRDDFSEDALIARDEIDDESLITRMIDIMDSRSYEEMNTIERRAIINGVDRTNKKPGFASRLLTKFIYKLAGKKN